MRETGEGALVAGGIAPGPTLLSALLSEDDFGAHEDDRSIAERQLLRAIQASR